MILTQNIFHQNSCYRSAENALIFIRIRKDKIQHNLDWNNQENKYGMY